MKEQSYDEEVRIVTSFLSFGRWYGAVTLRTMTRVLGVAAAALLVSCATPVRTGSAPTNSRASTTAREHNDTARQLARAGQSEQAIEQFRLAIAAAPDEWRYSYYLGEHLLTQTRWTEALEAFRGAWDKGYRRGITRHKIGLALFGMEQIDEALEEFQRAIQLNQAALDSAGSGPEDLLRFQLADSHLWAARIQMEHREGERAYSLAVAGLTYDARREFRGDVMKLGHSAFAERDYDVASRLYELSLRDFATGGRLQNLAWDDYPNWRIPTDVLIEVVENRKTLGRIEPKYTHRVLALVIRDQDVEIERNGRQERVHRVIDDRDRREAESRLKWVRQVVESMSDGKYSLSYVIVDDTTAYRYRAPTRPDWIGDRRIISEHVNDFDTIIRLWPYGEGSGTGGSWELSLEPVSSVTTIRGIVNIAPLHSHGMWIHEFFHVFEAMAGIRPTHGYYDEPREQFPGWTGPKNAQLHYYRWHFRTTLAEFGWSNLNFRIRYPVD